MLDFRLLCAAVAICSALGGCASFGTPAQPAPQQTRITSYLDGWVGQTVAAFAAEHGDPASQVSVDDSTTAFRWVSTSLSSGTVVPIGGTLLVAPPRQLQCTVVFYAAGKKGATALKDFMISRYEWSGNC